MAESAEELGLLAAIRETPDEDAPRLIYADWLEDHGQPGHAEFIRGQIALHAMEPGDAAFFPLVRRLEGLEQSLRERLTRGLPKWAAVGAEHRNLLADQPAHAVEVADARTSGCWKGLPAIAGGKAHRWLLDGDKVLDRCNIRGLALTDVREAADELCVWPGLERVRALSLDMQGVNAVSAARLLGSDHLCRLRVLSLSLPADHAWPADALGAMGDSPALNGLHTLAVNGGWVGIQPAARLVEGGGLRGLRGLWLAGIGAGPSTFDALAGWGVLGRLDTLVLRGRVGIGNAPGPADMPRPRRLRLENNYLPPVALPALAASGLLERVEDLSLAGNRLGPAAAALAEASGPGLLWRLDLGGCFVEDATARALAAWPRLRLLADLNLANALLTARGVSALCGSAHLARLRRLDLSNNPLGSDGLRALAGSPLLAGLDTLLLQGCEAGGDGAEALARSPHAAALRVLDISDNPIGDAGGEALLSSPLADTLAHLDVSAAGVGPHVQLALRKKMGGRVRT